MTGGSDRAPASDRERGRGVEGAPYSHVPIGREARNRISERER